jgi:hypothetical protein
VSAKTLRELATTTVTETDAILRSWHAAFERGDCRQNQVSDIIDALLDLRSAACLKAALPGKKEKVS